LRRLDLEREAGNRLKLWRIALADAVNPNRYGVTHDGRIEGPEEKRKPSLARYLVLII